MTRRLYTQADLRDAFTEGVADTISDNAGRFNSRPLAPANPYADDAGKTATAEMADKLQRVQSVLDQAGPGEGVSSSEEIAGYYAALRDIQKALEQ